MPLIGTIVASKATRAALAVTALISLAGCASATPKYETLEIGGVEIRVEIAATPEQQAAGLSGRTYLPADTGMLFPLEERKIAEVWAKGMSVPVEVVWLDGDEILEIIRLEPCVQEQQCPIHRSPGPVTAILEVAEGTL